jgi:3-methyladenine DNA glycosylase AlkD
MPPGRARAAKTPRSTPKATPKSTPKGAALSRWTLPQAMKALEAEGAAQTRKTYARHGAKEPLFGVSFASLAVLVKKIGIDHDLALALWDTGNFDARNLAFKVADPARMTPTDLDRWARDTTVRMCAGYVSMLASERTDAVATATRWLAAKDEQRRCAGWGLVTQLAARDEALPDAWFGDRLAEIERTIRDAPNWERHAMNDAVISIGGRSAALRRTALAAAKRIGRVAVDHGDTACKTRDAGSYLAKMWAHAKDKGFESPSAQERKRQLPRIRC